MCSMMVELERPCAIAVSGFDPSGGAGMLADIKTLESLKVYGTGVVTAITAQNDSEFTALDWVNRESLYEQLEVLLKRFPVRSVKFGIIESIDLLLESAVRVKKQCPDVSIVWDPVLCSTTGYSFHEGFDGELLKEIFECVDLITPNQEELEKLSLFMACEVGEAIGLISDKCGLFVTGGDRDEDQLTEVLVVGSDQYELHSARIVAAEKHGSGCVFSTAATGFLAHGWSLYMACKQAGQYSRNFLKSSRTRFGFHQPVENIFEEST